MLVFCASAHTQDVRSGPSTDLAERLKQVRSSPPGSIGRRNTGVKSLCWGFKLQGFTWSFI
jgi:hypothetical protein